MSSSEKEKRCLYEVLGLSRDCSTEEIRSAYRKLALQRHPDKLIKSGLSEAEATAQFQELVNAYEVLSDQRERAWYDSHRSQILFSSSSTTGDSSNSVSVPDLFSYFSNSSYSGYSDSGKGFYKVYGDVFDKIFQNELTFAKKVGVGFPKEAPLLGNLGSPYEQVAAFYNYWVGFVTVMDFCWVDQYDVMMGPNRKSRRVMEEENKKLRKKARREYNETVRGLAEFAKKRDKRVIDMQLKKNEEMEMKKEEERKRKEELARLKAEKARNYEEPEWTKTDEVEDVEIEEDMEENGKMGNRDELYCVACGKKFKSEKQWKNHEQSKKHKEKVIELREAFDNEDREFGKEDTYGSKEAEEEQEHGEGGEAAETVFPTDCGADELSEQFDKRTGIGEENVDPQSADTDGFVSSDADIVPQEQGFKARAEDDEASILESMVSGQKNRNKSGSKQNPNLVAQTVQLDIDNDEVDYMEYNNVKGSRRKKGGRRQRGSMPEEVKQDGFVDKNGQAEENTGPDDSSEIHVQSCDDNDEVDYMEYNNVKGSRRKKGGRRQKGRMPEEVKQDGVVDKNGQAEENTGPDDSSEIHEQSCDSLPELRIASGEDAKSEKVRKLPKDVEKNTSKQDSRFKSKETAKGKKKKASAKVQINACEKCGEEFETRNKLHKHLSDTGHASLKSR